MLFRRLLHTQRALNAAILQCTTATQVERLVLTSSSADYDSVNLATAFAALVRRKSTNREAMDKLISSIQDDDHRQLLLPRELSNICYSVAKSGQFREMPPQLVSRAERLQLDRCDPQSVSNTLWAFAKLGQQSPALFTSLQRVPATAWQKYRPQGLVNILWAHATLGCGTSSVVLDGIAQELSQRTQLQPQDISNSVWAFATLGIPSPVLFQSMARLIVFKQVALRDFRVQDLANVAWAFAQQQEVATRCPKSLFDQIAKEVLQRPWLSYQEIARLAWSFATATTRVLPPHYSLFDHLEKQAIANDYAKKQHDDGGGSKPANAQDVANILWAFATIHQQQQHLNNNHRELFDSLLLPALRNLRSFTPQAIANTLWACSKVHYTNRAVLAQFTSEILKRELADVDSSLLCNMLYSHAALVNGRADDDNVAGSLDLYQRICDELASDRRRSPHQQRLTAQDVGNVMSALASVRFKPQELCRQLLVVIGGELSQVDAAKYSPQNLSNVLLGLAVLDCGEGNINQVIDSLASALCAKQVEEALSPQAIANCAWAFSCLDALDLPSVVQWFTQQAPPPTQSTTGCTPRQISAMRTQLEQAQLAWSQSSHSSSSSAPHRIDSLLASLDKGINNANMVDGGAVLLSSKVHLEIASKLKEKHFPDLQNEAKLAGVLAVDIYIPGRHNAVVEVDGPSHFFSNLLSPTGTTKFKARLLQRAGYHVHSVNVKAYCALRGEAERDVFLGELARRI